MLSERPAPDTRPRVIHVTTAHRADDVRIFERECRSLAASGRYDVYLAAAGRIPNDAGVTHIPLQAPPESRLGRFVAGPRKGFALPRVMSADVWHFHDPELLPVAIRLARSGQRVIWDAHEDYVSQFGEGGNKDWVPGPVSSLVRRGTAFLLGQIDRHAAGIIAATPTIAARYSNPRTVVVGNEARLEDFQDCQPDFSSRRVLFTGNVGASHLFGELVGALRRMSDVQLTVAGASPDPHLWSQARAALGDRLKHVGWLNRGDLAAEISSSALGAVLYGPIPAYLDPDISPTKFFEFAAAGLPMICTPLPSLSRLTASSRAGFLADGYTSAALEAAIRRAIADRNAWTAASEAGRAWAQAQGSWTRSEKRLLGLYATVTTS